MFVHKNVDVLSILNQRNSVVSGAWDGSEELIAPTNRVWPIAEITRNIPYDYFPYIHFISTNVSASFNKIIFPSITPYSFLTQSVDSYLYYLDVYTSKKIPLETTGSENIKSSYGIFADSSKLVFENSASQHGYSAVGLIPNKRAFTLAWGYVSESRGIPHPNITSASYQPNPDLYQQPNSVYNTYKAILHESSSKFTIGTGSCDHVFIIHLDKEVLKNGIVSGSVEIPFMRNAILSNYEYAENIYTSSCITLTDDIQTWKNDINIGSYSNIVSGTLSSKNADDIYGKIYYELGILIFDGEKLNTKLRLNVYTGSLADALIEPASKHVFYEEGLNHYRVFKSLQACSYLNENTPTSSLLITSASKFLPKYFKCKTKEDRVLNPIYVVVKPNEFNYTTNPSWIENELNPAGEIESGSIPVNCDSFTNANEGCSKLQPLEQRYVYWYYPSKQTPSKVYASYFYKYEKGDCDCEFLGELKNYKSKFQLPHLRFKKYLVKRNFLANPVTYITTIGLYDDMYRLLAVAKLSKPLKKDSVTTYMFKVVLKT